MPETPQTRPHEPGPELLKAVKVGFIRQGTTFGTWCRRRNVNRSNARVAVLGGWRGPKARRLVSRIRRAAGLS